MHDIVRNIHGTAGSGSPDYRLLSTRNADGESISYRAWRPASSPSRAAVLLVPGFKAHSGRYDWIGRQLASMGFAAHAVDLRGRGESEGPAFVVEDFEQYVQDVEAMAVAVRAAEGHAPSFVVGHSAGAVVALLYAIRHQQELAGAVAMGIAQELPAPGLALWAFKLLGKVLPRAPVLKLKSEDFTRDREILASMNADPLIATEAEPLQTVAALIRATERLRAQIERLTVPVLFMHGTADRAARPSGSESLYAAAGSRDKQLQLYEGVLHEPLADLGRERVLADLLKWLDEHVTRVPPAAGSGESVVRLALAART
jgi:alpha-beta hydrolase superfamily lysophospholipase